MDFSKKGVRAKQKALHSKSIKWGRKIALTLAEVLLILVVGIGIIGLCAGVGMFKGILASTPQITSNDVAPIGAATFVYDAKGNKIDELVAMNSNRIMVTMDKIPDHLAKAFVAIEDERYYIHNGIDIKGLVRAGFLFVTTFGKEQQGASTITQQLLKNTIFTEWTEEGDNMIKKLKRKFQEQYLAIELTKILSKDEILERYMNTINLGQNTLGVEAAAQRYFGKSVSELTISESATIAAITQNPSKYNPIRRPEQNVKRRNECLKKMLKHKFITQAEFDEAMADDVYSRIELHNVEYLAENSTSTYFVDALTYDVRADLLEAGYNETQVDFLMNSGGLRIMSTLDPDIQEIVDEAVANPDNYPKQTYWLLENYQLTVTKPNGKQKHYSKEMMAKYMRDNVNSDYNSLFLTQEKAYEAIERYRYHVMDEGDDYDEKITITVQPQVSVVIMDQYTGHILAMSGGRGVKEGRLTYNRATNAYRQPGSTFKVLAAYAPALDSYGMNLTTIFNDAEFYYDDGKMVNNWYKTGYRGLTSIRTAIEQSMNVVAVKCLTTITPQLGYDYLLDFGFTTLTNRKVVNNQILTDVNQSLALGGVTTGVSNEELTAAYAAIANNGLYTKPKLYTKVLDSEGRVILDNTATETKQVIKETTAFLLNEAMIDVVQKGTGGVCNFNWSMGIAGKTGTTTANKDIWFAGYTPYYTCTTWAGYDNNISMRDEGNDKETNIAKFLWKDIMSHIHEELPNKQFEGAPEGIVEAAVCSRSGKLPIPGLCDATIGGEFFEDGTVPTDYCDVHYQGNICGYDGMIATAYCPFIIQGSTTLTPIENAALYNGSIIPIEQEDGSFIYQYPRTNNYCSHDEAFFTSPDYQKIVSAQIWEINQNRHPRAQQAAAAQ